MKVFGAAALVVAVLAAPAFAQTANDDMRCLIVSNGMGPQAKDEPSRNFAASTAAFYMGRISDLQPAAITAALRHEDKPISGPESMKILEACAVRAKAANDRFVTLAKQTLGVK